MCNCTSNEEHRSKIRGVKGFDTSLKDVGEESIDSCLKRNNCDLSEVIKYFLKAKRDVWMGKVKRF